MWLGVTNATKELFENLVPLQEIYDENDAKLLSKKICDSNINQVIFSSFCFGWEKLANEIKNTNPNIKIKVYWHGSHSQVIEKINWNTNLNALRLHKEKIIYAFSSCKKSIINFYKAQNYRTSFIANNVKFNKELNNEKESIIKDLKIGLYAAGLDWRKNMYNQLAAISLVDNATADLIPLNKEAIKFANLHKLNITGYEKGLKREELLKRIQKNDINLYVTFSECAPMFPIESLECGVLCLLGNNNHYFKNTELEKYLVVDREDDVIEIYNKIIYALDNKEKIFELYKIWKEENDKYSLETVNEFIEL